MAVFAQCSAPGPPHQCPSSPLPIISLSKAAIKLSRESQVDFRREVTYQWRSTGERAGETGSLTSS